MGFHERFERTHLAASKYFFLKLGLISSTFYDSFCATVSFTDLDLRYRDNYFLSQLWPLLKQGPFFETAGAVAKIGSSLKSNHNKQI